MNRFFPVRCKQLRSAPFSQVQRSRTEEGALALFAALILLVLVGFIALSIDTARYSSATEEKRNTADQVALAALETYYEYDRKIPRPRRTPPPRPGPPLPVAPTPIPPPIIPVACVPLSSIQCDHREKFKQAIMRAEAVGNSNYLTARFGEAQIQPNGLRTNSLGDGDAGTVVSGRWWIKPVPGCVSSTGAGGTDVCPCGHDFDGPSNNQTIPCFQTCDPDEGCMSPTNANTPYVSPLANAMRVMLKTAGSGQGVRKIFGAIWGGSPEWQATGVATAGSNMATAYALPKYGVVMLDLSRSTTVEQYQPGPNGRAYLPFEKTPIPPTVTAADDSLPGAAKPQEFAYQLATPPAGCPTTGSVGNPCLLDGSCDFVSLDTTTTAVPAARAGDYTKGYDLLSYRRLTLAERATYQCFQIDTATRTSNHLINMAPNSEPQPYLQLLQATSKVLADFKTQGNAGDRISLVGFDHDFSPDLIDLRTYPQTPPYPIADDPKQLKFIDPSHPQYIELEDIVASNTAAPGYPVTRQLRAERGFFPRSNALSDIPAALQHASDRISAAVDGQFWQVDPFVILVTNGMSNCSRGPDGSQPKECYGYRIPATTPNAVPWPGTDPTLVGYEGDAWSAQANNEPAYTTHVESLAEIVDAQATRNYNPNKIRLHVVYAGKDVEPHSVLIKDDRAGVSGCLNDDGLRRMSFVNGIGLPQVSARVAYPLSFFKFGMKLTPTDYSQPGVFLDRASVATQGWFLPIRKACPATLSYTNPSPPGGAGTFSTSGCPFTPPDPELVGCENLSLASDQLCGGMGAPSTWGTPPYDPLNPDTAVTRTTNSVFRGPMTDASGNTLLDPQGKLLCDPKERSEALQVRDFMKDIMTSRPILLVE